MAHFKEFSHPGDSDYNSETEDRDDGEDDDRPECEFGIKCYRWAKIILDTCRHNPYVLGILTKGA